MSGEKEPRVAEIEGVEPIFWTIMLRSAMATRYCRAIGPSMSFDEGLRFATATWETDWDTDPEPRTFFDAMEAVDSDLEHWGD